MMTPGRWSELMDRARREARVNGSRRKVVAVMTVRRAGWAYVVQCGPECSICRSRVQEAKYDG